MFELGQMKLALDEAVAGEEGEHIEREMKMSLKLMTCCLFSEIAQVLPEKDGRSYVLMAQMLEKLQLAVCALGQNGCAEGLHDLLDRHRRASQLVFSRAMCKV